MSKAKKANAGKAKTAKAAVVKTSERDEKNGVTRPGADTLCARVWDALDKLHAKGEDATFDAVRELAGKEMADATIRTQRQRWRDFMGIKREPKKARKSGKPAAGETATA